MSDLKLDLRRMMQRLMFGPYSLSLAPLQLMEGRRIVELSQRHLEVLALIVKAQGEIVPKEVFFDKIWGNSFVEEGNLTQTVFLIRRALGKLRGGGDYIETLPRRGYRLARRALQLESEATMVSKPCSPISTTAIRQMSDDEHYHLLVNSIEDYAVYMLDCAGHVLTWNRGAETSQGFTRQEVLGQHYSMFFVPEDIDARLPERQLILATKNGRCSGEGWRMRRNGDRFWASFVTTWIRNSSGKLLGFAKVVRDLSERKRQDDILLRTVAIVRLDRDRLLAVSESSMDALYVCEAVRKQDDGEIEDFTFTFLNRNVEKMVSVPRDVLIGGRMCDLLPFNRELGLFEAYKQVVLTGEPYTVEVPVHAETVKCEWIRIQAVRLEDGVAITASDITERKRAEARIAYLAHHDSLTGLPNLSLLPELMRQAMERIKRYGGMVGVCVIDLDGFKQINGASGHFVGDSILTIASGRIVESLRAIDSVVRIGGDEFAVVLSDMRAQTDIIVCAQKIIASIQSPMKVGAQSLQVTCSVGIAFYPESAKNMEEVLIQADKAMCTVKRSGKNGLSVFRG